MKKDLIHHYLEAHDLTTETISGLHGTYGLLFALLLDGKVNVASMDHTGEIHLTTATLSSGVSTTTRHTLMDAVHDGMIATLTELTRACLYDTPLSHAAVVGQLGSTWVNRHAEHRNSVGMGTHILTGLNAFPSLHFTEAAD